MIIATRVVVLVFAAWVINGAYGQSLAAPAAPSDLMCIEKIELPSYPVLAQQARIAGTVIAEVVLSSTGSAEDVNIQHDPKLSANGNGVLANPVLDAVRHAAFDRSCGGRTVALVFVFQLAGTAMGHPRQTVAFGAPNKFWIRSEAPHFQP